MTITDEMRGQLRERRKAAPPPFTPPAILSFRGFSPFLAWDGTLSHCGWVLVERTRSEVMVRDKGTIHISTDLTGYLGTWEKARLLRRALLEVLDAYPRVPSVVEGPAVKGNRLESSLIAGLLIWLATEGTTGTGCPQVSATHVSSVLLGDARIRSAERKKAIKKAVARYVPESETRSWDEHQRDALAVGLTHLHDLNRDMPQFTLPSFT